MAFGDQNGAHFYGAVKDFFEEVEDDSWIFGHEVPSSVECHQLLQLQGLEVGHRSQG